MAKIKKTKTVYILGAGFSVEAQAPSQEKLVSEIFRIHTIRPCIFNDSKIDEFIKFLEKTLGIPERLQKTVPLEDIFTPLDRKLLTGKLSNYWRFIGHWQTIGCKTCNNKEPNVWNIQ